MVVLHRETPEPPETRVQRLWPDTAWVRVWHQVADDIKMIWYWAIHDIYPTHVRLHRINMITSPLCRHCNTDDVLQHRLADCGEGRPMWDWTRDRLARILRTTSRQIEDGWVMRPNFTIWPPNDEGLYYGCLLSLWHGDCNSGTGWPGKTTMISQDARGGNHNRRHGGMRERTTTWVSSGRTPHKGWGKADPSPRWAKECRVAGCESTDDMDI
jgi:hypothetical protein